MDGNFKRGGGLLCYIKDDLQVSGTRYRDLNCSCKDLEMQWLSLNRANMKLLVVVNVYRPTQGRLQSSL